MRIQGLGKNETLYDLYRNLSIMITNLGSENLDTEVEEPLDESHAYLYILFVLMFYAFSIVVLMVKYIKREREGHRLESYYDEFVKRSWYTDKSLYDKTGRKVEFNQTSQNFVGVDEVEPLDSEDEMLLRDLCKNKNFKKKMTTDLNKSPGVTSLLAGNLASGLASSVGIVPALPMMEEGEGSKEQTNGTLSRQSTADSPDIVCRLGVAKDKETRNFMVYHRASLDEALELKNIRRLRTSFKQNNPGVSSLDDISSEDED